MELLHGGISFSEQLSTNQIYVSLYNSFFNSFSGVLLDGMIQYWLMRTIWARNNSNTDKKLENELNRHSSKLVIKIDITKKTNKINLNKGWKWLCKF